MVTEYMQGGDLGTALARDSPTNRRLGWYNNGIHIALSAARGLAYLHAQKVTTPLPACPSLSACVKAKTFQMYGWAGNLLWRCIWHDGR